jgi:hypothetical protein
MPVVKVSTYLFTVDKFAGGGIIAVRERVI